MEILKPYRDRIDALDRQILDLLRARYDVIEEVGRLKAREGIAATLPERVEQVREQAARYAASLGLDEDLIRDIYSRIIADSCALEERIKQQGSADKPRAKASHV